MNIEFRKLVIDDIPLLFEWMGLEHVGAWWRETRDYKVFFEKYSKYVTSKKNGCYFICDVNKPIGFIIWHYVEKQVYALDIFIADLDYVGKGYGAKIIKQFIDVILIPLHPKKIIIDPEVTNERAIHVYEKVGFKKKKIIKTFDGTKDVDGWLMELDIV